MDLSNNDLLSLIERTRKESEFGISYRTPFLVNESLKRNLTKNIGLYNNNNSSPYYLKTGITSIKEVVQQHNYSKSILGTGMFFIGFPMIKKRFVTKGSVEGTSIASKFLSNKLSYNICHLKYIASIYMEN
ncbi:hypothetical protein ETU09_08140 [Apibacter muscae]|uniref:Uncharacterized protein n=1 Tax=Apibacter muscae TaxID=2509004 RepID=A0A563DA37_9FLAO|nr:hypothetical protein [Apibacter muscae]TWP27080.1 hypothetical protein ETU09_08140 [Apibacter muscae]